MKCKIQEIHQQSDVIPPRDGQGAGVIFWRMTVADEAGNPHAVFVTSSAGQNGRDYTQMIGNEFELTFKGGDVEDRDGSVWKKAKLDKPGQGGRSGGGGGRSGGGGGQGSGQKQGGPQGGSGGGRGYKPNAIECPRDDFFRRCWVLYFESATSAFEQMAVWRAAHPEFAELEIDKPRFFEQVGKVANQAIMELLIPLPYSSEQKAALDAKAAETAEAEKKRQEEEAEKKRLDEERAAQKKLEEEQAKKATAVSW